LSTKKYLKAKKLSKSSYNPLSQVDYPLFQKSAPIGFVLLSIPTTMQILKTFRLKVFEESAGQTDGRTNKLVKVKLKVLSDFIRDQLNLFTIDLQSIDLQYIHITNVLARVPTTLFVFVFIILSVCAYFEQ
jgi:hypothetical protein|tara:strand:+ start:257 stop:649 length:393 start_codon:yes stop_codon:yes gene_type:complete